MDLLRSLNVNMILRRGLAINKVLERYVTLVSK